MQARSVGRNGDGSFRGSLGKKKKKEKEKRKGKKRNHRKMFGLFTRKQRMKCLTNAILQLPGAFSSFTTPSGRSRSPGSCSARAREGK
ncbi:hypothetical protein PUN28_014281 [Cardiocondyla obscurior]|uniref:Uncharacterized protein n=1 Tax=Cardiocondyla obscurior TaxID=286306 RepID=A0AAW2F300_9HYME